MCLLILGSAVSLGTFFSTIWQKPRQVNQAEHPVALVLDVEAPQPADDLGTEGAERPAPPLAPPAPGNEILQRGDGTWEKVWKDALRTSSLEYPSRDKGGTAGGVSAGLYLAQGSLEAVP